MRLTLVILITLGFSCNPPPEANDLPQKTDSDIFLVVLGIAQDAGYPQAGCNKPCCQKVYKGKETPRKVVSLGLVDRQENKVWMLEVTPDFKWQLHALMAYLPEPDANSFGGVLLTHAHIGHYTGLINLGHEVMGADRVPVYVMPKMKEYLTDNGPWSQLVTKENINMVSLTADSTIVLSDKISISPFLVPHRDEYSETVGFKIQTASKKVLFIPDIDKWSRWDRDIVDEVVKVDMAFVDATFHSTDELPNRNMSEILHPFVPETMDLFDSQPNSEKQKIIFTHFNHTNPLLLNGSESDSVRTAGYQLAREGQIHELD